MKLHELKNLVEWDNPIRTNHNPESQPDTTDGDTLIIKWRDADLSHTAIRIPCRLDGRDINLMFLFVFHPNRDSDRYTWKLSLATSEVVKEFSVSSYSDKQSAYDEMLREFRNMYRIGERRNCQSSCVLYQLLHAGLKIKNISHDKSTPDNINKMIKEAVDNLYDF